MEILHIVTPVSRPDNLPRLYRSIRLGFRHTLPAWWVIFDPQVPSPPLPTDWRHIGFWGVGPGHRGAVGYPQRNWALDQIGSGWVYFLDDDNLIHPNLEKAWSEALLACPGRAWYIFRQVRADGSLYLAPHCPPRVGAIDVGQVLIRREALGTWRFEEHRYDADGRLLEAFAAIIPPVCWDAAATYYNALR